MPVDLSNAVHYLILLLIVGNLFAIVMGVLLMAAPERMAALRDLSNRWVSTRQLTKPFDVPHETDQAMLRYPRTLGAIMLASGTLILIKGGLFVYGMSVTEGGRLLAHFFGVRNFNLGVWESLWLSLMSVIMLGALLALLVGVLSLFMTPALERIVKSANTWLTVRRTLKPLAKPNYKLDRMVTGNPQLWGGAIVVVALYAVAILWWIL